MTDRSADRARYARRASRTNCRHRRNTLRSPLDRAGMRANAALANTAALFAPLDTELAPHARGTLAAARQAFTAAQATLGHEGASASNVPRALTQFIRTSSTSSALRALAGDLERHLEWLPPGTTGDTRPADASRGARGPPIASRDARDFYNARTDGMPNFPRSSMLVSYGRARCIGQSPSPHVVAPPSRPQSCVARRAS